MTEAASDSREHFFISSLVTTFTMAGHRRYATAPSQQQRPRAKSSIPPLAPLIFVIALLGPMHLSSSWSAVHDDAGEPKFLSRKDFQQPSRRKVGAKGAAANPTTVAPIEAVSTEASIIAASTKPSTREEPKAATKPSTPEASTKAATPKVVLPPVYDPNRHYQHSDLGRNIPAETFTNIYEVNATKLSFDVLDNPVFNESITQSIVNGDKKLKVLFLTQKMGAGKVQHVFLDGLRGSDYIELIDVVALPSNESYRDRGEDVWMEDSPIFGCEVTEAYAKQTTRHIPVVHLDYKDFPYLKFCDNLHNIVGGKQNIRYVKRSIVDGREYNWDTAWTTAGHYSANIGLEGTGGPIIHSPYTVRTDQVQVMQRVLHESTFASPVDFLPKPIDAMHFWGKGNDPVSRLRNYVTEIVHGMNGQLLYNETLPDNTTKPIPNNRKLRAVARVVGSRGTPGRRAVQEDYVKFMLKAKIVVVTQRDKHEDHYRLMEALMGGAMVAHEFMLSLPKGLVDRESVVLFRSKRELQDLIWYYTAHEEERKAIAQRGWEVAMGRHRSWHRMEEILFGRPLTDVNNPYGPYKKDLVLAEAE